MSSVAKLDYHALPRRQLQALCKKHGIPANGTNVSMANALESIKQQEAEEQSAVKEQQVDEEMVRNVTGRNKDIGSSVDLSGKTEKVVEGDAETLPADLDMKCERKTIERASRRRGCKVEDENQSIQLKENAKMPAKEEKAGIEAENCIPAPTNTTLIEKLDIGSVEAQKFFQRKIRGSLRAHSRAGTKTEPNSEIVELEDDAKAPAEQQNVRAEAKSRGSIGEFTGPQPNVEVIDVVESEKKKCQREMRRKASKKLNSSAAEELKYKKMKEDSEAPAKEEKSISQERDNLLDNSHSLKDEEAQHVEFDKECEKKPSGKSATTRACKVELEPLKMKNGAEFPAVNDYVEREHEGKRSITAHVTPQKEQKPIRVEAGGKKCQKKLRGNTSEKLTSYAEGKSTSIKPKDSLESPDVEASILTEDKDKNKEIRILSLAENSNPQTDGVPALVEMENNCERKVRGRSGARRACKAEPEVVSTKVKADAETLAMKENVEPHANRSFFTHETPQAQSRNKRAQRISKGNVCEKPAIEVERKTVFSALTEDSSAPVSKEEIRIVNKESFCLADDSHSQKAGMSDNTGLERKPKCERKLRGRSGKEHVGEAEIDSEFPKVNANAGACAQVQVEIEANNQEMPQKIEESIHVESTNRNSQRGLRENTYKECAFEAEGKAKVESASASLNEFSEAANKQEKSSNETNGYLHISSEKKDCQRKLRGRASEKLVGGKSELESPSVKVNEGAEENLFSQQETEIELKDSFPAPTAPNPRKGMRSIVVQSENKKSQRQLRERSRNKPEGAAEAAKSTEWTAAPANKEKVETAAEEIVIPQEVSALQKSVETEQLQPLKEGHSKNLRGRACIQLKSEVESESECVNAKEDARAPAKKEQAEIEMKESVGAFETTMSQKSVKTDHVDDRRKGEMRNRRPSRKLGNKEEVDLNSAKTMKNRTDSDKEEKVEIDGEFTSATVITEPKETEQVSEHSTKLDALRSGSSRGRLYPEAGAVSSISMVDISKEECVSKAYNRKSRRGSLANQIAAKVDCSETSLKIQARRSMRHNQSSVVTKNDRSTAERNFSKKSESAESDVNNNLSTLHESLTLDSKPPTENSHPVPEMTVIDKELVQLVSFPAKGENCTSRISAKKPVSIRDQTNQSLDEYKKVCMKTSRKDEKSEREKSISEPNPGSEASASVYQKSSRNVSSKIADATPLNISYQPGSDNQGSSFTCDVSQRHINFKISELKYSAKLLIDEIESNQLECLEETGKQVGWEEKLDDEEHATNLRVTEGKGDWLYEISAQLEKVMQRVNGNYEVHLTQHIENDKVASLEDGRSKYDISTSESQLRVARQNSMELFHKTPAFGEVCNIDEEKMVKSCEPDALCSYTEAETCGTSLLLDNPEKLMPIEEFQAERCNDTKARPYNFIEAVCSSDEAKMVQTKELLAFDEFQTVGTDFTHARLYGRAKNAMEEANCFGDAKMEDHKPKSSCSFIEVETSESSFILDSAEIQTKVLLPIEKFQTSGGNDIEARPCGWAPKSEKPTMNSELHFLMEAGENLTAEPSLTVFQVSSHQGKEKGYMLEQDVVLEQNQLADILSMKWTESGDKLMDVKSTGLTELHNVELGDNFIRCTDVTHDISLLCDQTNSEITHHIKPEAPKEILLSPKSKFMTWIVSKEVHQDTENRYLTNSSQVHVVPGDDWECVECTGNVSQECNLTGFDASPRQSEVPKEQHQSSGLLQVGEVYSMHVSEGHKPEGLSNLNAELLHPVDGTFCAKDKKFAKPEGKLFEKGVLPASFSAIKIAGTWPVAEAPIKESGRELTTWSFAGTGNIFNDMIQSSNDTGECREQGLNATKSLYLPEMFEKELCEYAVRIDSSESSYLPPHSNAEVENMDLPFHVVEESDGRGDWSSATIQKTSSVAQRKHETDETALQNSSVGTTDNNLPVSISHRECSYSEDLKAQPFSNENIKSNVDCILATVGSIMAVQDTSNRSIQLKRLVLEKAENSIDAVVTTLAERCQLAGIGKGSAWADSCTEVVGFMGMSSQTQELVNKKLNSPIKTGVDDNNISGSYGKRKILDGVKKFDNGATSEKATQDRINNCIDANLQDSSSKADRPKTIVLRSQEKPFRWELNSEKTMLCRVPLSEDEPLESDENESIETEVHDAYETQVSLNVDSDSDDGFYVLVSADDTEKATNFLHNNHTSAASEVEVLVEQNCLSDTLLSSSIERDAESDVHGEVDKQSNCIGNSILCRTGLKAGEEAKNFSSAVLHQEKESLPTTIKKLTPACSVEPAFPSAKDELNLGHQMEVEFHGKENNFDLNKLSLRKLKALYKEKKQNIDVSDHRKIVEKEEHRTVLTPVSVNIMEGVSSNYLTKRHNH